MHTYLYLVSVLCVLLLLPVQAEVYKWTDEHGRVHFSDRPPSEDTPEYQLRTPAAKATTAFPESLTEAERRARQKKLSDSLQADRLEKEQAEAKRKEQQAKREHNCRVARSELETVKKATQIYDYDSQGKRYFYNDVQRQRYLESKRAAVRKWCD